MVRRRDRGGRWYEARPDGSERLLPKKPVDWSRLNSMSEAEKFSAARTDPDAKPLTEAQLSRMRRSSFAKLARHQLALSQDYYAHAGDEAIARAVVHIFKGCIDQVLVYREANRRKMAMRYRPAA